MKDRKLRKQRNLGLILGIVFMLASNNAQAEITAIDFNGDLIGKVISDGKVISYDNEIIGKVTADSLITNSAEQIIGGLVPQGIAIGTDNQLLGKVNSDGSVRLPSGKIIGKVLPSSLVVNDNFQIIGGVLFPGLIYSDSGDTIGRLTGDGIYTDLEGNRKGYITSEGYAYSQNGNEIILDGKLISNKMVISPEGEFVGSVSPGGEITNIEGEQIGKIHANGIAYNEETQIVGYLVKGGYAFDEYGNYLGIVNYNGIVENKGRIIGYQGLNNEIHDSQGKRIGFWLDFATTIGDNNGKYVGRLMPEGKIAQGRQIIGTVGPRGTARDANNEEIGKVIEIGPVYDYRGNLKGQISRAGDVRTIEGSPLGYAVGTDAYETNGRLIGGILKHNYALDLNNKNIGISGIRGEIKSGEQIYKVSSLGYVYSSDDNLGGQLLSGSSIYGMNGSYGATVGTAGVLKTQGAAIDAFLTQSGIALRKDGSILGGQINAMRAISEEGTPLIPLGGENLVLDKNNKIIGKILPDKTVVKADKVNTSDLMPEIGLAQTEKLAIKFNGETIGYAQSNGEVKDMTHSIIGKITSQGNIIDNNKMLIGGLIGYKVVVDESCTPLGYVTTYGDVRNTRGVKIGKIYLNNQVTDEAGTYIGYGIDMGAVKGENGILGTISADGKVLDKDNKMLGCLTSQGRLYNANGKLLGLRIEQKSVIDFNNKIIGRTILDNQVVNNENQIIGQVYPDESVKSNNKILGRLLKYQYAFSDENKYIGLIDNLGKVHNADGEELGFVTWEGYVKNKENQNIGYALYDMYLYNENNKIKGIVEQDGNIRSTEGSRIGKIDRGFLVNKEGKVLSRGNRDYYIINEEKEVVGELQFNGEVKDSNGHIVGRLGEDGNIVNDAGEVIAVANPLQYYNVIQGREKIYDANGNVVGYVAGEGDVYDENGKLIGKLNEDGTVTGADGNVIGGKGKDWYAQKELKPVEKELPEVGIYTKEQSEKINEISSQDYKKSLNIALTPDGEYLGDILEDGRVVDKNGKYIGRRMPDGLIMDDDGSLIGIEEVKRPEGSEMFVPAGTFGNGGAYGIGTVGANLGPGGGFGPGERYDPQRAAALAAAQNYRRQNIAVGHVASSIKPETFDGYQKNWDNEGIAKAISSWRVDMSEMILADKPIPAVIARSIDSNNPTPVTAYVERNVYAEEGRNIIIPAGSRLMGSLNGMTATTETTSSSARVQITWERLIRPDGVLFTFQGITADAMGRGGALGYLDQQLFKKYTLPVMTTLLTSYTSYLLATDDENNGEVESSRQQAANDARENFLTQMNDVFSQILADKSNIKPLTYVPAGTRIIVFPNVDLWLRTPERDADVGEEPRTDLLIDDKKQEAEAAEQNAQRQPQAVGGGNNGQVVYQSQNGGNNSQSGSPKLINDDTSSNINGSVPPPPPPPASENLTPAVTNSNRETSNVPNNNKTQESKKDESVPQLF